MKEELISVIVPIYNVEQYLEKCLESILNQTYKNLEIILINDGSTDNSGRICKYFLEKDDRIKYIEQKNQGLSAARNHGIHESKGKYYIFIDSDDYINVNYIDVLYTTLIKTNSDIAMCYFKKVYDKSEDIFKIKKGNIIVYEGDRKFYNLYNNKSVITVVAWNKIYKKEIFSEIRYPVGKLHEDEFVICDILKNANKVAYNTSEYYYYLQRKNGITGKYNKKRAIVLEALSNRLEYFRKNKLFKLYSYTLYNYFYQLIYHYNMFCLHFPQERENIKKIYNEILRLRKEILKDKNIKIYKKIKLLIKLIKIR